MAWTTKKKSYMACVTQRFCRSMCVVKKAGRSDRDTTCPNEGEVRETVVGHPRREKKNRSSGWGLLVIAGYSLFFFLSDTSGVTRIRPGV